MTAETPQPLPPEALIPPAPAVGFRSTADLEPLDPWAWQDRALEAMRLSAEIGHHDFNLYVLGPQGGGRRAASLALLREAAAKRPAPQDWVYINNFEEPQKPKAIALPPGTAPRLRDALKALVDEVAAYLPALFESEEYQSQRRAIEQSYSEQHESAMEELLERGRQRGVTLLRTPMGLMVAAVKNGEPIKREIFEKLPKEERDAIDKTVSETQAELEAIMKEVPGQQRALQREVEDLNAKLAEDGVGALIDETAAEFDGAADLVAYFAALRQDMIDNAGAFLAYATEAQGGDFPSATRASERPEFRRYAARVMVCHAPDETAPVVEEDQPTLANLVGRIDHQSMMGALITDFTMIRPGALHRANGGYLLLDALRLLMEPFAWDGLKSAIRERKISTDGAAERLSLFSTQTLAPDPIPLTVRVALVGDRRTYHLLSAMDPDFAELFKIAADFDDEAERTDARLADYARIVAGLAAHEKLRPLDADGFARLAQESARLSGDAERLSLNIAALSDMLREADHRAAAGGRMMIGEADISAVIDAAERRSDRVPDLVRDQVLRETVLIDTDGARVGMINALSVMQLGRRAFGRPSRVTARVRMGAGKLVDIERETELGGPIHSKGVMILQSYLSARYATEAPMSLWASIVFEQSYGGVDGDSASTAELVTLLSALAEAPIDQSFAITGSVNQLGEVQAIGGANEKIEGFFDVCDKRGLTGRQGVLIPKANVKHLALRPRVIEAVKAGRFRIIPIASVAEAATILTGLPCGERGVDGGFPPDTLDAKVEARLIRFAEARRAFAKKAEDDKP